MADYHIVMKQALVLNNLNGNLIYTGPPPFGNALQSCSAIIMVNPATGAGGLYHYPAGPFLGNGVARTILDNMQASINPTEIWLYFGNVQGPVVNPADTELVDLSSYLLGLGAVNKINNRPATSGAVSVTVNAGAVQINTDHMAIIGPNNLTNNPGGAIPGGHLHM